jgi:hypothetical protein
MEDIVRSQHCVDMFAKCSHIEGDVAECGVAFGQTTFMLDPYVLKAEKKLYAFDTFSGLPYDDSVMSQHQCKKGEMDYGKEFFDRWQDKDITSIVPVRGLVEETLGRYYLNKFCFVWLDMDLYQPTSFAYKFFEDRVPHGGIIGFHDYKFHRCPGVEIVVDKEVDYQKYDVVRHKDSCLFIRRK